MEGSGGIPPTQPPPFAKDADEAAALALTKRARKRSRYLSPPYTDTDVQEVEKEVAGEEDEEEPPPPNVSVAETLSALGAAAQGQGVDMDPAALRFLALYGKRNRATTGTFDDSMKPSSPASAASAAAACGGSGQAMLNLSPAALSFLVALNRNRATTGTFDDPRAAAGGGSHDGGSKKPPSPASAAAAGGGGGHTMLNFSAGPAMPGPGNGSPALALSSKRKNPNADCPMQNAAAQGQAAAAANRIWAYSVAANAAYSVANPAPGFAANAAYSVANPAPPEKKRKKYKKRVKIAGHEQEQRHFGNPAALVLDFAAGTPLPSKEDLVSTFRRFGLVVDSETTIAHDKHRACVAFSTRAEAEAACSFSCAGALGAFGAPSVVPSIQDLPPIGRGMPPPLPKLPLTDVRSNLVKMIASLKRRSSSAKATAEAASPGNLAKEMQGLLAKVDKMLQGQSATAHQG